MASLAMSAAPADADPVLLADWLELSAFFDSLGRARLDDLDGDLRIQAEEEASNNADEDSSLEDRRAHIESEIEFRSENLEDSYPFELSEDGEELRLKGRGRRSGACFYLTCLIISHFTKSPILSAPPKNAAEIRKKQFQILSTLAIAGNIEGPAISFGWPRASGETIKEALTRFTLLSQSGLVRPVPGPEASKYAKDGGMDVIAWKPAINNAPPPSMLVYGQAASGHGWSDKSAKDEIDQFTASYFTDRPAVQATAITVVPFRLSREDHLQWGHRHGHILDRLRTPKAASRAVVLSSQFGVQIDEVCRAKTLNYWLLRYKRTATAA